jgi:hypothetical protein
MGTRSSLEKRLAEASVDDVLKYSTGAGLKEAKDAFSAMSRSTTGSTKGGDVLRGGIKPHLLGSSTKLEHNETSGEHGVLGSKQLVQYLQPSNQSGIKGCNTCGSETKGCKGACLSGSGQLGLTGGEIAKQARTKMAWEQPDMYLGLVQSEIRNHERTSRAMRRTPVVRLNGTSDVGWHRLGETSDLLIGSRPGTQFNEYTKFNTHDVVEHEDPNPYSNYHWIHSLTENTTVPRIEQITKSGRNVAVPLNIKKGDKIPDSLTINDKQGRSIELPTVRTSRGESAGDAHDMRHLDERIGGAVALRAKEITVEGRRGVFDKTGFIRPMQSGSAETPVQISRRRPHNA